MVFTTATFLIFLALVFALYWSLGNRTHQNILLVIAGYSFYAWWDYRYCALMLISTMIDYCCGFGCSRPKTRRLCLVISLLANLGMLGIFKYFDFIGDGQAGVNLDAAHFRLAVQRDHDQAAA